MSFRRIPIRSPLQKKDLTPEAKPDTSAAHQEIVDKLWDLHRHMESSWGAFVEQVDEIKNIQKGEQGEQGPKGEGFDSEAEFIPYMEWMLEELKRHIPAPLQGEAGIAGPKPVLGVDYFTEAHKQEITSRVLKGIRQPQDGETPTIDHDHIASEVVKHILSKKLLKKEHIDGLDQEIASYRSQFANGKGYVHGGGDTVAAGTDVTITTNTNGSKVINATSSGSTPLTPTGTVDPAAGNVLFGVTARPSSVVADGITFYEGFGYTYLANQITMANPPSQYIRYYL